MFNSSASQASSTIRRFYQSVLPLLLVLALLAGTFAPTASAAPDESRVLPQLQREAAANPSKQFRVIVTRHSHDRNADDDVAAKGGGKLKELPHDAFVAELPGRAIQALGRNPAVKYVAPDAPMRKLGMYDPRKLGTLYPQAVKAASLWSSSTPVTGAGVGVAVLDTGVDDRVDFRNAAGASRIVVKMRFNAAVATRTDGHGHGTHIAGIIAGNSWHRSSSDIRGKYVGIAPEAHIISVRVSDDAGMSYVSDVVTAIDWVIQNRTTYNIRVLNLSLVSSVAESATTSVLAAAVERAWFNGIFVVVSAGNAGADTMQYPPANDPFVVTVGAADPMGTARASDDTVVSWSSYGATQDGHSKPDVVAPGRYIAAPWAGADSVLSMQYPDRVVDGQYLWMSGTSMAAPVVSGVAALAFQAHPEWTNDQVKWLLLNTSNKLVGSDGLPLKGQGKGEVSAEAVVRYTGKPGYANQGLAPNEQLVVPAGAAAYNSASWNTASWNTASWNTASWNTASWNTASWNTSNFATASWNSAPDEDAVE